MEKLEKRERTELFLAAVRAREFSYCPYSGFAVGAALLCEDGTVVTGCNIENAAYGPSICAERTAAAKAVSEGRQNFRAIAVAGGHKEGPLVKCYPCGVCRQVLSEFAVPEQLEVLCGDSPENLESLTLSELLPRCFSLKDGNE